MRQGAKNGKMQMFVYNQDKEGISMKDNKLFQLTREQAHRFGLPDDELTSGHNLCYGDWRVLQLTAEQHDEAVAETQ